MSVPTGMTVSEFAGKTVSVRVVGSKNRLTVDLVLWFAREAQKAVEAGMPLDTEVRFDKDAMTLTANYTLKYELQAEGTEE